MPYILNSCIIILDEQINALDEAGAKQVHEILEEQKKRGALNILIISIPNSITLFSSLLFISELCTI